MRKRILSILLCLVMVVALFPTMAFAVVDESDNIISQAGATIAAPVGGETPSFTATSEDPSKYSVRVYNWIDLERNMDIKAYELADPDSYYYNYTFKAGKEYAVVIGFTEIEGGAQLSTSTQFFINGNQSTRSVEHFRARRYDFTATGSGGGTVTPTYTATVDSIDFGSVKLGYTQPDYKNLTITNTGNFLLSVNVDSVKFITGSEYFQLATFNSLVSNIPVGGQCTSWSVCPKANLNIGTYTATVQFQDSKGEMSAPATATVTFKVEDHDYDTTKWEYDANSHWNPCKDSGCNAKGNIAEHDRNKEVGGYVATFDTDGKTPDLYCSVCNRNMQSGEAIAAGKYIRESKATMSPAAIDSNMCANDLFFTSLEPDKYTVQQFNGRVFDLTEDSLNTSTASGYGYTYPMDKKFISGHQYAIEFLFSAVAQYAYNETSQLHWSTFTLNGAATIRGGTATFDGATNRRIVLTAGAAPEVPVTSVSLPKTLSLIEGEFKALTATVKPDNATNKAVVWSSDNESIAMVDQNGVVEAKAPGTAIITAKSAADTSKFDTCTVTVVKEHGITVTGGTATVGGTAVTKAVQGTVVQLTAKIPENERFARWETISGSTSVTFENANSSTTTFTMPDGSVAIKAVTNKLVNAPIVNTGLVYNSHNQMGVNANTGYTLGGIYAATNAGSYTATATLDTGYIWADGSTNVKSINWSISMADQNAPTGLAGVKPTAEGANDGKITGVNNQMEYRKAGTDSYSICTDSEITGLVAGNYEVRFTETVNFNASPSVTVTVPAGSTVVAKYTLTITNGTGSGDYAENAAVTITANAPATDKVFDKWVVLEGNVTLADATKATTTFTMPASAVSVKATYKNAPHTHTYNQETVKPEALKTAAGCTSNAVYFKSCSCGAISTTDTFVAMNTALGHDWSTAWTGDSTGHWHKCTRCDATTTKAAHDYGSDNVCDTCGYNKTVPHTHNLTLVAAKAATCTTAGNSAYYTCDGCDKWFEDATGSVEITDKTSVKIPAPGHTAGTEWKSDNTDHWKECTVVGCGVIIEDSKAAHTAGGWIIDTPATATTSGSKHKECTVCRYTMATETIPATGGGYYYAPTAAVVPDMPMLYRGCTGDAVKTLQDKLNALGYNSGNVDGIFGAKTYAAVTAFQKANSLGVDGIVGKLTWGKLYGVSPAMPVETTTVVGRPMVSYGSRGDAVRKLQELLNALGYDCGSVDGIFGSKTKAAVLAFQKANGLGVDGIVGPLTWAKLG